MRRILACAAAAAVIATVRAQVTSGSYAFTTLAGRAVFPGSTDAVGVDARFNRPYGIVVDPAGNLYVTDAANHSVRKIAPDGRVTTLAGRAESAGIVDGTGADARFGGETARFTSNPPVPTGPFGIALLPGGTAVIADGHHHVIRQLTPAGGVSHYAGVAGTAGILDGPRATAQFALPLAVAADASGAVFVADTANHVIRRIAPGGAVTTIAGSPGNWGNSDGIGSGGRFLHPTAIAVSPAGNVYVVDCTNSVRKLTRFAGSPDAWEVTTLAGKPLTFGTNDGAGAAARFGAPPPPAGTPGGTTISYPSLMPPANFAPTPINTSYVFGGLIGIAADAAENVYVTDGQNNTIRKISPAGVVTTIAGATAGGSSDGIGPAARFSRPAGIAVDAAGFLYVADFLNNTVRKGGLATPPKVESLPENQSAGVGANVSLTIRVSGFPAPIVQWARNGVAIPGATTTTLHLTNLQPGQAGNYTATLTNAVGIATTPPIGLTVSSLPAITAHPVPQSVPGAAEVTLRVGVVAAPAPTYQWLRDGTPIAGATAATLVIPDAREDHAGEYRVVVTNANGSVTSNAARVSVNTGRLVNLSIRTSLGTADALLAGFVVSGGSKPLLVRAVGPGLRQFGVGTAMPDPQLSLQVGPSIIATSDNWFTATNAAQIALAANQVGAFPFLPDSQDAAVLASVADSAVTAQTSARGNAGGVVLLEVYDTGPVTLARLVNVSTRTRVGVGEEALFAGFTIGGNSPRTLLIRAVGPTLGSFGVSGVLSDPMLEVFADGAATPRAVNNNWGGDPALTATFARVSAFPLPSANSLDAALVASFEPGTYSARVSGAGGTSGEALLEIYEVP